jgi:hypothetical protein
MCIKGIYRAKGGEKFLTIGFFDKDEKFIRVRENPKNDPTFKSAYYFIDDVSLVPVDDPSGCNCTP